MSYRPPQGYDRGPDDQFHLLNPDGSMDMGTTLEQKSALRKLIERLFLGPEGRTPFEKMAYGDEPAQGIAPVPPPRAIQRSPMPAAGNLGVGGGLAGLIGALAMGQVGGDRDGDNDAGVDDYGAGDAGVGLPGGTSTSTSATDLLARLQARGDAGPSGTPLPPDPQVESLASKISVEGGRQWTPGDVAGMPPPGWRAPMLLPGQRQMPPRRVQGPTQAPAQNFGPPAEMGPPPSMMGRQPFNRPDMWSSYANYRRSANAMADARSPRQQGMPPQNYRQQLDRGRAFGAGAQQQRPSQLFSRFPPFV